MPLATSREKARRKLAMPQGPSDEDLLRRVREKDARRAERHEHERIRKALEAEVQAKDLRAEFFDRIAAQPDPKPYKVRKRKGQGKSKPAAAHVMPASDWHMGERVDPDHVGGRNEHTPEISEERAEQFFRSQLKMLNANRSAWDIRQGVLWLGGDFVTGYLREENLEENWLSPVQEALLVYRTLVSGIRFLLDRSDLEHLLIPTSFGNHGRTGQKLRVASGAKNSYEWMLYQMLADTGEHAPFKDEIQSKRVTFQVSNGYHNLVDLYGFRIQFHHGDAVGYAGGIGGLSIPVNRRIGRQAASIPVRWEGTEHGVPHLNVFGHFHTLQYPKFFIGNGSLIGWNDFAERIGAPYEDPQQCSFVVDERYKAVSNFTPIFVSKRRY